MGGMSEREYSSHSGISRGAIQKARKAIRLVVHVDWSVRAVASAVRRGQMTDPDQLRRSLGGNSGFCAPETHDDDLTTGACWISRYADLSH